jgi:acetyltransferase AlgX (SGNH hydrolase-like protein)
MIMLITLSMGEISLRIYDHYIPSFIFYSGSYNRFRGKPFADDWDFKLNSHGFKDEEFSNKKENVYRILGVGDSFSFGVVPYKYNYLTLIESQVYLQNVNIEVFNMGIPSIGPKDYLSLLVKEGLALQPNMVLLSFFIGNDFEELKKRKLYEYSYVASLLHYIINLQPEYEGRIIHGKGEYCDDCPNFNYEEYLKIESQRSLIYLEGNSQLPKFLDRALYYLNRIKKICEKRGVDFVVVIIPDELQINQDLWREIRDVYYPSIEDDKWNITRPNRMLSNELNKLSIDNIDLYEYFADASSQRLYRPRDTHWNIAGNQLAADVIEKYIQKYLEE